MIQEAEDLGLECEGKVKVSKNSRGEYSLVKPSSN